jgi:hypothetical protein
METLKTLSPSIHSTFNSVFFTIFDQSLQNENGSPSFGQDIFSELWRYLLDTLVTEEDARAYEHSVSKLYTVQRNEIEEETNLFRWWLAFWASVGMRFPQVADNQIEILLDEFIKRSQSSLVHILQVRFLTVRLNKGQFFEKKFRF